jgi:GDP-L-fucose synthase
MAKLAGVAMCQAYRTQYGANFGSVIPTNQYGPNDNFDPKTSHLIGSLLVRLHEAKLLKKPEVVLWGTGQPRRDFMFVDDLAESILFLLRQPDLPDPINIGTGRDFSIAEIARLASGAVGYEGSIAFDSNMPDGAPQKLLDVSRLEALGWRHQTPLADGLLKTYDWFEQHQSQASVERL